MTKRVRKELKRLYAQGYFHLNQAGARMYRLYNLFNEPHPDYGEYIATMIETVLFLMEQYKKLGELAWGKVPDDLEQWRK